MCDTVCLSEHVYSGAAAHFFSFLKRLCLSLLGRLAGSDRDRLWKQAEMAAPEDSPDGREEMEVALQQVMQQQE